MKIRAFAAMILLTGCFPVGLYYKAGAPVAKADDDLLDCKVMAEGQVPERRVTRVIPGAVMPPRRICDAAGNCHMIPGRRMPPEIVVEDANAGLRKEVAARCMTRQGYTFVQIPQCQPEVAGRVPLQATTVMPRLTRTSCAIRLKSGRYQIVDPG